MLGREPGGTCFYLAGLRGYVFIAYCSEGDRCFYLADLKGVRVFSGTGQRGAGVLAPVPLCIALMRHICMLDSVTICKVKGDL